MKEITIYHSFNARNLTSNEVAKTFIKNKQYTELLQINHSLLLGPRGCGKTTLLKMLTPEANYYWNEKVQNDKIILPFYGVYIPTDSQWKIEFNDLSKSLYEVKNDFINIISKVIVTTNIVNSIITTFQELIKIHSDDENIIYLERALCIELIEIFNFDKPISPDLNSLESQIRRRLSKVNELINKTKSSGKVIIANIPDYYFSDFFSIASEAFFSFKKIFTAHSSFKDSHFRWALCFDELELAPEWLQENLLNQLRSRRDQSIIYKLTSTPIVSIEKGLKKVDSNLEASNSNDYNVIGSWTYNQSEFTEWRVFANKLADVRIKNYLNLDISPENIFDKYDIERILNTKKKNKEIDESNWDINYRKGTAMYNLIVDLSLKEKTFRDFLINHNINPFNPIPKTSLQMGILYRKMKPLIIYRSQFIKSKSGGRKNIPFYFGVSNIYDICDGNPRFLTGLIDDLLVTLDGDNPKTIRPTKQSEVIYKISKNFLEIVASHPDATIKIYGRLLNLAKIVEIIGEYFFDEIANRSFKINPVGSFVVDSLNPNIIKLIELGIRVGAFVYLNPNEAITETGILNKQFRLSYLLHPNFKLPIREYESRKLSTILKLDRFNDYHPSLFNEIL